MITNAAIPIGSTVELTPIKKLKRGLPNKFFFTKLFNSEFFKIFEKDLNIHQLLILVQYRD